MFPMNVAIVTDCDSVVQQRLTVFPGTKSGGIYSKYTKGDD